MLPMHWQRYNGIEKKVCDQRHTFIEKYDLITVGQLKLDCVYLFYFLIFETNYIEGK